jgi:flagellin-like hook-associated protein FlgL
MAVINTNVKALFSENALANTGKAQSLAMQKLATGKRINSARDDAAGIAISTRMTQQIRGLNQAVHNAGDAINLIQTAEGATNSITEMMQRMRELAVQAANDTNDTAQRGYLDLEFQQLKQQIEQISKQTEWNGFPLLDGTAGELVGEMPVYKVTSDNQYGTTLVNPVTSRVITGTSAGEQQILTISTSMAQLASPQTLTINVAGIDVVLDAASTASATTIAAKIKQTLINDSKFNASSGRSVSDLNNVLTFNYAACDGNVDNTIFDPKNTLNLFGSITTTRQSIAKSKESFGVIGTFLNSGNLSICTHASGLVSASFNTSNGKSILMQGNLNTTLGTISFNKNDGINSQVISSDLVYTFQNSDETYANLLGREFNCNVTVEGSSISALRAGDLIINGVGIGASYASDDKLSPIANAASSAIAKAAAINRRAQGNLAESSNQGKTQTLTFSGTIKPGTLDVGGISVIVTSQETTPAAVAAKIAATLKASALYGSSSGRVVSYNPDSSSISITYRPEEGNVLNTLVKTKQVDNAPSSYNPGQQIIDLGSYGKLIAPVQVDGNNWYYFWDRSGDGTSIDGTGEADKVGHDVLDGIFNQDINGNVGSGNTDDTYRYATLNGVRLALPTMGGAAIDLYRPGTVLGNGSTEANPTYNDLLAIWDAYNGTGTGSNYSGTPTGWAAISNNSGSHYWSSTYRGGESHSSLTLWSGYYGGGTDSLIFNVALQVLPQITLPPVPGSSVVNCTVSPAVELQINLTASTGVFAKVNENVMSGRAMSGDSVVKGNVFINGYASAGITTVLNNPSETRANVVRAINLISNKTGVKAIDTGTEVKGITLTAADGRNIEVSFETDADKDDFGSRIGLRQGVQSSTISLESKIKAPVVLTSGSTGDITRSGLISGNFSKNESVTTTSLRPAVKANIDQLEAIKYTGSVSNSDSFSLTINGKTYSYTAPATGTVTLQMVRNGLISAVNADTSLGVNASGGRTPTEIYLNANVAGTAFTLSNSKSNTTTTVTTSELRANYISDFKALLLNDLIINGVKIPASNGADDSYSNSIATSSDPASSAIAISAAINSQSVLTGVMAKANGAEIKGTNTDTSLPISSGPTTHSLFINGTEVRVQFIQGELIKDRLDKVAEVINTQSGEHGVTATNNGQGISLKSDGRNLSVWFDSNVKDLSAANFGLDEGGAIARSVDVSFNGSFANTDTASLVINGVRVASAANAAATASGFANVMKTAVDAAITSGSIKNVSASVNGDVLTIKSTVPGTNFKVYWASMGGVFPVGSSMSINYVTPNDSGNTRTTGIFNAIASSTAAKTVYGSVSLVKQPPHDKNKYAPMNIKPFTVSTGSNGFDAQSNFSVLGFHEGDFGGRASSDMDPPRVGRLAFQVGSGAGQLVTIDLEDFGKDGPITSEITGDVDQNLDQRKSRINTREGASDMLTKLDLTMDRVNAVRSNMGAVMNRLDHIISNVTNVSTNMSKSRSVIEDADYATASSELAKAQIMQQAATAVLAQANTSQQAVLKLLG